MDNTQEVAITTLDNPFDPFEDWLEWYGYDIEHGYNTVNRLGRITTLSEALSDEENNAEVNSSIDELMKTGAIDKDGNHVEYRKVYRTKDKSVNKV